MVSVVKKMFNIRIKDLTDETRDELYFKNPNLDMRRKNIKQAELKRWEGPCPPDASLLKPKEFKNGTPLEKFEDLFMDPIEKRKRRMLEMQKQQQEQNANKQRPSIVFQTGQDVGGHQVGTARHQVGWEMISEASLIIGGPHSRTSQEA